MIFPATHLLTFFIRPVQITSQVQGTMNHVEEQFVGR